MGFPVELQIRSKIQHSWATAVEVVGTFTKQALKSSKGDADWLAYFKFASAEFSKLEGYADTSDIFKGIDTYEELKKLALSLEVDTKLRAFNVAIKNLDTKKEDGVGYYILILKLEENLIQIARFNKNQFTEATDYYNAAEEKYKDDISKDLVMVSASSLKALKKAYPNYFSDTIEFSKYIAKVHEINGLHTVIKQKSK
jgi:tetratricopeptide (TPR) repeat protein